MNYDLIVIGTSAGGIDALKQILTKLNNPNNIPIIVLQHISTSGHSYLASILNSYSRVKTLEVEDKMPITKNHIYVPAPNYHVLMEKNWTFSLNVEKRVSYARPSIDVLFESVADACHEHVIALLLTGANHDGANGMKVIGQKGGYTIVQSPDSAYASEMPESALKVMEPDYVGALSDIKQHLEEILINDI